MASPSEDTKRTVLGERAKLPDNAAGDGVSTTLPNISTLETMLSTLVAAAQRGDRRRFIKTQVSYGSS